MNDILDRLKDLHKQATTECSHYYVASCCRDAIDEIKRLRKMRGEITVQLRDVGNGDLASKDLVDTADASFPSDLGETAERWKMPFVIKEVWRRAYVKGYFRCAHERDAYARRKA